MFMNKTTTQHFTLKHLYMDKIFENKEALITGASYGIGRATAIAFAQRGSKVVVADWVADKECTTLKGIKDALSEGIFVQCDVSKDSDVKALIDKTIAAYGRLDFAFNNAGIE